jgi:hypothetical protein
MRFLITWTISTTPEADQARILSLFSKWQPPVELKEWSGFADGTGGMAIADTDDAAVLANVTAPWTPWLDFTVRPLLPIQETAQALAEAAAFRSSVS